jgi:hypothetical protein
MHFSSYSFPFLLEEPYNLLTLHFWMEINAHVISTLDTTGKINVTCVVSCLTRCQSDSICISIRLFALLKALRTLKAMTGQGLLQIMLRFSWCKICVNKWKLAVSYCLIHRALKVKCMLNSTLRFLMPVEMQEW